MPRLIIRPDFDGLVCAVYLKHIFPIESVLFAEPKDIQDGLFPVLPSDIIANLPYHPACSWWFDHHASNDIPDEFRGVFEVAPSAAGLIWEAFKSTVPSLKRFNDLTRETDKIDGALLDRDDILSPKDYVLVSFTVVPSRESTDYEYWNLLIDLLDSGKPETCLQNQEVMNRIAFFLNSQEKYRQAILAHSSMKDHLLITDFRNVDDREWISNRFLPFAMFEPCNIQLQLTRDRLNPSLVKISLGKSILNRSSKLHVGRLLKSLGGGGHEGAGSTRVPENEVDKTVDLLVSQILPPSSID
ncbi:MAG: hypothetical protein HUU10_00080 [Bacteroidetes bacterium]|nr:hypothetical protein [Bacteroidota bacterium]